MDRCFLFQGQGSQIVGMGADIIARFPVAKNVYEEVDEAIGEKISSIILNGPKESLDLTENTQPALMAMSMAVVRVVENLTGKNIGALCKYMAGHSLGEYSAICAAGVISIADAARILKLRGKSMQETVPVGEGAMAAILGASEEEVSSICKNACEIGICEIANNNAPGQIVISGQTKAIEGAIDIAKSKGFKAIKLEVSAPFHCKLMTPVAKKLLEAFSQITFQSPSVPIISNFYAKEVDNVNEIKEMLIKQTSGQVQWQKSINFLVNKNCTEMAEFGTGKVLIGLNKRINPNIISIALNSVEAIETFARNL